MKSCILNPPNVIYVRAYIMRKCQNIISSFCVPENVRTVIKRELYRRPIQKIDNMWKSTFYWKESKQTWITIFTERKIPWTLLWKRTWIETLEMYENLSLLAQFELNEKYKNFSPTAKFKLNERLCFYNSRTSPSER